MNERVRLTALLLSIALLLAGCGRIMPEEEEPLRLYATCYPIWALTRMVTDGAPGVTVSCIMQPQDECVRDYVLSDWDVALLAGGVDCIVSGGRGLELSSQEQLQAIGEQIPLAEVLYGLELLTGENDDEDSHFSGDNPHLYMSFDGAKAMIESLAAILSVIDPQCEEQYAANESAALDRLNTVKREADELLQPCAGVRAAVMHEAFIYPANDYGMDVVTTIYRESAEGLYDAALERCLEQLAEANAQVVLLERQAPQELIDSLKEAGYGVICLDVFSTHGADGNADNYFEALLDNARIAADVCAEIRKGEIDG